MAGRFASLFCKNLYPYTQMAIGKYELRVLIRYFWKGGLSTRDAQREICDEERQRNCKSHDRGKVVQAIWKTNFGNALWLQMRSGFFWSITIEVSAGFEEVTQRHQFRVKIDLPRSWFVFGGTLRVFCTLNLFWTVVLSLANSTASNWTASTTNWLRSIPLWFVKRAFCFSMTPNHTLPEGRRRSLRSLMMSRFFADVAPSDCGLFRSMQHFLKGRQFESFDEVEEACQEFFDSKEPEWFLIKFGCS